MDGINNPHYKLVKSFHELKARDCTGQVVLLERYKGYVCLFVNIASKSLLTEYSYKLLNETYNAYEAKGLRILAFPCNQFNNEEPEPIEAIHTFFTSMGARYDLFDKVNVNGKHTHQLFKYVKQGLPIERTQLRVIKDSFTMFLFSKTGDPYVRLEPPVSKEGLFSQISAHLGDPLPNLNDLNTVQMRPWRKKPDTLDAEINAPSPSAQNTLLSSTEQRKTSQLQTQSSQLQNKSSQLQNKSSQLQNAAESKTSELLYMAPGETLQLRKKSTAVPIQSAA